MDKGGITSLTFQGGAMNRKSFWGKWEDQKTKHTINIQEDVLPNGSELGDFEGKE